MQQNHVSGMLQSSSAAPAHYLQLDAGQSLAQACILTSLGQWVADAQSCMVVTHGPSSLRPVHMFLLAGQSNMAGRGQLPDPAESKGKQGEKEDRDDRLLVWGPDDTWKTAQHPLHYDKPEKAGVGPGLSFAQGVVANGSDVPEVLFAQCLQAKPAKPALRFLTLGFSSCACGAHSLCVRWQRNQAMACNLAWLASMLSRHPGHTRQLPPSSRVPLRQMATCSRPLWKRSSVPGSVEAFSGASFGIKGSPTAPVTAPASRSITSVLDMLTLAKSSWCRAQWVDSVVRSGGCFSVRPALAGGPEAAAPGMWLRCGSTAMRR